MYAVDSDEDDEEEEAITIDDSSEEEYQGGGADEVRAKGKVGVGLTVWKKPMITHTQPPKLSGVFN